MLKHHPPCIDVPGEGERKKKQKRMRKRQTMVCSEYLFNDAMLQYKCTL